jgi:hypothetical protein
MKIIHILIFGLAIICVSCFEKDQIVPLQEYNGQAFVFTQSIYSSQFFYDLSSNKIINQTPNNKWDLSFESKKQGYVIRINSSNLLAVLPTNETDFNITNFTTLGRKWNYDKSDGNPDSTAISKWVNTQLSPYNYSGEVFLLGQYDGINYNPLKKFVFYSVTDTSYRFKYANIDGSNLKDVMIKKDSLYNCVFYSISKNDTVYIEPLKSKWDLLFSQYSTTLYTDAGTPVPYFVRGTLINAYKVKAALDSIHDFSSINLSDIGDFDFKTNWDIIGHNWKSVEVNQQANTAKYEVRANYNYIIEDSEGDYYKLKFISFFNALQSPGYPTFIIEKLK